VLGVIRSEIILHFQAFIDLTDHALGASENYVVELGNEPEEVGIESDSLSDSKMEVLHIIVSLECVHEDREAIRPHFLHPKPDYVGLVEEEELATCGWVYNTPYTPFDPVTLNRDLVCRKKTESEIAAQNCLDTIFVIVVVVRGKAMTCQKEKKLCFRAIHLAVKKNK
jgi:hypothetical protein